MLPIRKTFPVLMAGFSLCCVFLVTEAERAGVFSSNPQVVAQADAEVDGTTSFQTSSLESSLETSLEKSSDTLPAPTTGSKRPAKSSQQQQVCDALKQYPKASSELLSFRTQTLSSICQPFVRQSRPELDRCGAKGVDPYASLYTWPSRAELASKKGNLYTDEPLKPQLDRLKLKIEEMRIKAANVCCGSDSSCRAGMAQVEFEICQPKSDPNEPDPCVFGGSFHMPGSAYDSIFTAIKNVKGSGVADELRSVASKNLSGRQARTTASRAPMGRITLSSYVPLSEGIDAAEPVIAHELGHACSMVKMKNAAVNTSTPQAAQKALRAAKWLDSAKKRCNADFELPEASFDFWESMGESRELATCLNDIAIVNQKQAVDKPCNGLCVGHYLEESVGVAFSLLVGDLNGSPNAVFPNTCDHVRDAQHPLVSDVAECLAQYSPRFRERLSQAYSCSDKAVMAQN